MLHAQIFADGDFSTGTFTGSGWTLLGTPTVVSSNPPPSGSLYSAEIQSTDASEPDTGTGVSTSIIASDLGISSGNLPSTEGTPPGGEFGIFGPQNGQAIYQTFSLDTAGTLSFEFSYQTADWSPYDSVGFVLDGVYTQLVATPVYNPSAPTTPDAYQLYVDPVALGAGTHTLGFVAYNTGTSDYTSGYSSTTLYVGDITVPEPGTWVLFGLGLCVLAVRLKIVRI